MTAIATGVIEQLVAAEYEGLNREQQSLDTQDHSVYESDSVDHVKANAP